MDLEGKLGEDIRSDADMYRLGTLDLWYKYRIMQSGKKPNAGCQILFADAEFQKGKKKKEQNSKDAGDRVLCLPSIAKHKRKKKKKRL